MAVTVSVEVKSSRWEALKVPAVIAFYMVSALTMIFVNKAVLNSSPGLPLTFLAIQLLIAVFLLNLVSLVAGRFPSHPASTHCRLPAIDFATIKALTPFVAVGVTGLAFNTLCLAYVDAAFFQIARGMLLPLTAVVSSVVTRNPPSYSAILAILIVSIGYFVGITPSAYFTSSTTTDQTTPFVSIIYGTLSSLFLAVHAVLVKPAAQAVDGKVISLVYYGNVMSAFVLLPLMVLNGEVEPFLKLVTAGGEEARVFAYGSAVTGLFGFFIGLATIMSIKVTSPVSHMFSSAARTVIQSVLSVYIFGDIITTQRGFSILVILLGTLYYTYAQSQQKAQTGAAKPPSTLKEIDVEKAESLREAELRRKEEAPFFSPFEDKSQGESIPPQFHRRGSSTS